MPYFNPDLKRQMLPSLDQLIKYVEKANTENTNSSQRDVRQLMSFLQRLCEIDSYLLGLVQTRKLAAKSYKSNIRMPIQYKITPTEEKQLGETKARFRNSRMISTIDNILDGVLYSMDAVKLRYENNKFGTMVVKKENYDLTDLDFSDTTDGLVNVSSGANGLPIKSELDPEIHLITRHNPQTNRKNHIGSLMRTAMLLSYTKYFNRWDWRNLNSRHGNPSTYATYPEHLDPSIPADKKKIDDVVSMVEKLKNDAAAVFPEWVKVMFDTALKSDQTSSFDNFIQGANLEMAVLFHGQNLTTEVRQGSKAAATVHDKVDDLIIAADLAIIEDVFSNQYLKQDYLLNYGEPRNDFFEFCFIQDIQQDYESNSRIIQNIIADPELKKTIPLKKSEVYDKLGFTQPQEGDEVI